MPRQLSEAEVSAFRSEICRVAVEVVVARGYQAVTMREIARRLGCSAMTPYRYFANKSEIFAAVRAECVARFREWMEREAARAADVDDPIEVLRRMGRAYVAFALAEPRAYRLMFEVAELAPGAGAVPRAEAETWGMLLEAARSAVARGALKGDPEVVAHLFWAGFHGIVALHHSGRLQLGKTLDDLIEPTLDLLTGGQS